MTWRNHLKVHPAADLFPMMSEPELRELGEDIKENGQRVQVVLWKDPSPGGQHWVLDGRNRLDAMELVGMPVYDKIGRQRFYWRLMDGDPYEVVLSLNLLRRNLTDEQRRELIAKVIKAKPEASNVTIAKETGTSEPTVRRVRKGLSSSGDEVDRRTGRAAARPQTKKKPKSEPKPAPGEYRAAGSEEVSIEQRQAEMAQLDEPAETAVDEVDRRVSCVTNTILRHIEGLSCTETERLLAALRSRIDEIERDMAEVVSLAEAAKAAPPDHPALPADLSIPDFLRRKEAEA